MRIGITFDLKDNLPSPAHVPDDFQEEFDSPATIEAIAGVLRGMGHDVVKLGNGRKLLERLLSDPPDFVFNFAEGRGIGRSREARVPAVLEMLDIPYSGSDPLTLATTLDKDCARRLVASADLPVPRGITYSGEGPLAETCAVHPSLFPAIIKPAWEGSSKGIRNRCLVDGPEELAVIAREMRHSYHQPLLIEEFIEGDELTVGIIGNDNPQILGIMRVLPKKSSGRFVYSLEVKRDYLQQVTYECPARLSPDDTAAVREAALRSYRTLGCRDVARVDFRLREGIPYFIEVNPLPGLNPESSDLVIMARLAGWSYERLIESIVLAALDRHGMAQGVAR